MTPDPDELTTSQKRRINLIGMSVCLILLLLVIWLYATPRARKCYCNGQPISCEWLEEMRRDLRVNGLSQDGLRNCY